MTFHHRDAGDPELAGSYQLVTVFEAIHDMPQPVGVLRSLRGLAAEDGAVVVMDERVADTFTAPGDEVERLMYTYSILCCLPVGLADSPSVGTGTVMRADTLRGYAAEAGFAEVEVLPIEHDFFRFYRLQADVAPRDGVPNRTRSVRSRRLRARLRTRLGASSAAAARAFRRTLRRRQAELRGIVRSRAMARAGDEADGGGQRPEGQRLGLEDEPADRGADDEADVPGDRGDGHVAAAQARRREVGHEGALHGPLEALPEPEHDRRDAEHDSRRRGGEPEPADEDEHPRRGPQERT